MFRNTHMGRSSPNHMLSERGDFYRPPHRSRRNTSTSVDRPLTGLSTSLLSIGASLAHNRQVKGSGLAEEERFER